MTDLIDIVPRNTTPLQRSVVRTIDSRSRYGALVQSIIDVRYLDAIPQDVLPWLLRHWGLEDAAEFVADHQRLYKEGKRWQTLRGRVEAYEIVFDWLGLDGFYERGDHGAVRWGLFQIGLTERPDQDTLLNLIGLANLSKKASSVLGRIYGGYDIRPMRLDMMRLDGALLDDWSGVYLPGIEPKLSFGKQHGEEVDFNVDMDGGVYLSVEGVARFEEGFVLDRSMLDGEVVEPSVVAIQASLSGEQIDYAKDVPMPWPRVPWPSVSYSNIEQFTIYGGPDGTSG
ncbi:hypothetical protein JOE51_006101 [Bradyrhizobium japonicum]|uniref:hypothetical protein n=1 Tax=Bradyrhizobium japonicum TaxID=375 RepID=UPI001B582F50|nr:hypothetical protein [Bradyrhizobium japonicum]MBP1064634.1 hypothetical protein [Bradyrhizobium japonicum]WLB15988.1 hypothetical protein QIH95_28545 [Bradyrhizobium japonicum]